VHWAVFANLVLFLAKIFANPKGDEFLGGQLQSANRRNTMLNNIGIPGLLLIAVVVLVLFGRGKVSGLMGEVGKGITAFKKGVSDGTKEIEDDAAEVAKDVTEDTEKDKV
jgi:sec-independent protein translocase protein TatA